MDPKRLLLALVLAFSLQTLTAHADPKCVDAIQAALTKNIETKIKEKLKIRYDSNQEPSKLRLTLRRMRDGLRDQLQVWQRHDFPWDPDMTALKAYAQVRDAYNPPVEGTADTLNLAQFRADNQTILQSINHYKDDLAADLASQETAAAQSEVLKQYIASHPEHKIGITLKLPVIQAGSDDVTFEDRYFGNRVSLKNQIAALDKQVDNSLGRGWFKRTSTNDRAFQQAKYVRRMDYIRHWILSEKSKNPDKPLPAELASILEQINELYVKKDGVDLKPELQPPYWAWNMIRWKELWGEMKSLYVQQLPKVGQNEAVKDVVNFVKNLSPEDQRVLGVDGYGDSLGLIGRTKWVNLAVTAVSGAGLTGTAVALYSKAIYDFFMDDAQRREVCADKPSESDFLSCLNDYINVKYSIHYVLKGKTVDEIVNDKGEITHPKVDADIKATVKRRLAFLADNAPSNDSDEAIRQKAKEMLYSDDSYRLKIIRADDKKFKSLILGDKTQSSYLGVRFPKFFESNKELVGKILDQKVGSTQQNRLIEKLCDASPRMAEELKLLIDRHRNPNDPMSAFVLGDPKAVCLDDLSETK